MVITIHTDGIRDPELIRSYLDLTPRSRATLLCDLAKENQDESLTTVLTELHAKAQANPLAQDGVIPYQINYDQKILPKINIVTQNAVMELVHFIKAIIDFKNETVLDPVSDIEVEEILKSEDSTENKVKKILERIGGLNFWDPVVFDEDSFSLSAINKKLFAPSFLLNMDAPQPTTKMDLLAGEKGHEQLNCFGNELNCLSEDDRQLLNRDFVGTSMKTSEFYENLFKYMSEDKEVAELLPSQVDFVYQIVHNFTEGNKSSIDIKQNPSLGAIREIFGSRKFPPSLESKGIPLESFEFPAQKLPLGISSIALILNRIRKANLAYVYEDTRFFLK